MCRLTAGPLSLPFGVSYAYATICRTPHEGKLGMDATEARNARVLAIDDDDDLRTLVVRVVERAGYAVDSASDGQAGLDRLADRTYDVIVCDLRMPRMDGVSLAPRLRAMPQVMTCLTCQPVMADMARRVGAR